MLRVHSNRLLIHIKVGLLIRLVNSDLFLSFPFLSFESGTHQFSRKNIHTHLILTALNLSSAFLRVCPSAYLMGIIFDIKGSSIPNINP